MAHGRERGGVVGGRVAHGTHNAVGGGDFELRQDTGHLGRCSDDGHGGGADVAVDGCKQLLFGVHKRVFRVAALLFVAAAPPCGRHGARST